MLEKMGNLKCNAKNTTEKKNVLIVRLYTVEDELLTQLIHVSVIPHCVLEATNYHKFELNRNFSADLWFCPYTFSLLFLF